MEVNSGHPDANQGRSEPGHGVNSTVLQTQKYKIIFVEKLLKISVRDCRQAASQSTRIE